MIRIKLFALFIAFALLALVRPRKCLELLEAADRGALRNDREVQPTRPWSEPADGWQWVPKEPTPAMSAKGFCVSEAEHDPAGVFRAMLSAAPPECPLPPAGWRCTRRAGHDGPCAAVVK